MANGPRQREAHMQPCKACVLQAFGSQRPRAADEQSAPPDDPRRRASTASADGQHLFRSAPSAIAPAEQSSRLEPCRWRRRWPRSPAPLPASRLVSASPTSALSAPQLRPARPRSGGWYCTPSRGAASAMDSRRSSTPRPCSLAHPTPSRSSSSRQANLLALLTALHSSN